MNRLSRYIFLFFLFIIATIVNADSSIDNLLANIEEKCDLSLKTKQENGGVSYIFTRHDLDVMQVKHLRDILKSTSIGYKENRYNIVDPMGMGNMPFLSGSIRIFIDNQEVTSAFYGSGLVVLGDMDMSFVDHIEIYTLNPSFEFTSEPALTIIKLYSKVASRDEGGEVSIAGGSYGSNFYSLQYADELKNFSYFTYISKDLDRKKRYSLDDQELGRDANRYNFFGSIYDDKQKFLINISQVRKDGFMGPSLDGSPQTSEIKGDNLHIGYERKFENNIDFTFTIDKLTSKSFFADDILMYHNRTPVNSFDVYSKGIVYTAKVKHKIETEDNKLIVGIKYRYKKFVFDKLQMDGVELSRYGHDRQTVSTFFAEDDYSLRDNSIITTGVSYGYIANNANVSDQSTTLLRIGHTYIYDDWIFKTFGFHLETATEPYLINSFYAVPNKTLDTQKMDLFLENIKYKHNAHSYESIFGYFTSKDYLLPNSFGLIDNAENELKVKLLSLRWTYKYAPLNSLYASFDFEQICNVPRIGTVEYYKGVVRNIHSFKKFNLFEELVYNSDSKTYKDYFDLSLGAKYQLKENITISLKGENLLNKAYEQSYFILNTTTMTPEQPFSISPIDRKVTLSLEWSF